MAFACSLELFFDGAFLFCINLRLFNFVSQLFSIAMADALAELEDDVALSLLENIPSEKLIPLLNELDADEAADLLGELPATDQHRLLGKMEAERSEAAKELLSYPEDSAGGIMNDRFLSLRAGQTVSVAQKELRKLEDPQPADINYLYVTDAKEKLVGIVSLRDLVFAPPRSKEIGRAHV